MYPFTKKPYPPQGPPYEYRPDPYTLYTTGVVPPPPPPYPHPYIDPCVTDSYGHACYHEMKGFPFPNEFPVSGNMEGSAFILKNYVPYLYDNTHVRYGNLLNVAESVVTRVSRRSDPSCIDLFGTFDLTQGINKNTIMQDYLCKCIGQKSEELQGVFPIVQSPLVFRLYFSVYDEQNAVVYTSVTTASTNDVVFHFTDIRDYYVESAKSFFNANIPAMDYSGIYRLHLDKLEVYGSVINTYDHMTTEGLNPYYAFADNNDKITLQHDVIGSTLADASILLASTPIDQSIPFQANLTTRLKMSFTAFTSNLIGVSRTINVYNAMYEPTEIKLATLSADVKAMKEAIATMNAALLQMKDAVNELRTQVTKNTADIETNTTAIADLRATVASENSDLDARLNSLDIRVTKLESIPYATYSYTTGFHFVKNQLTWKTYGQLYQVTKPFTASGNITTEINLGYLVPLTVDGDVETQAIESRLQANTEAIDTLQTDLSTVTTDLTTAKSDITEIKSDLNDVGEAVAEAASDATTAKTTAEAAQTAVTTLEGTLTTLDTTVASLNTQVGELDTQVSTNTSDITDLKSEDTTINGTITNIQTSVQSHSDTLTTLSQTVDGKASQSDLEALVSRVEALENPNP